MEPTTIPQLPDLNELELQGWVIDKRAIQVAYQLGGLKEGDKVVVDGYVHQDHRLRGYGAGWKPGPANLAVIGQQCLLEPHLDKNEGIAWQQHWVIARAQDSGFGVWSHPTQICAWRPKRG